jgi:glutaredoxin
MRARVFLVVLLAGAPLVVGCRKREAAPTEVAPPAPVVRDDAVHLLFTWVNDEGAFVAVDRAESVPPTARDVVRVASATVHDPDPETVFVADLRVRRPDGTYAVSTMGRASFDRMATERRKAKAPAAPEPSSGGDEGGDKAVIYGASWCGPCHQAEAWFKSAGVAYVEHDIEEEPGAREAMQRELERSGYRGGSIPVIVWHGKVLVGFSGPALEAVRQAHL